jgi:hypothetical protein
MRHLSLSNKVRQPFQYRKPAPLVRPPAVQERLGGYRWQNTFGGCWHSDWQRIDAILCLCRLDASSVVTHAVWLFVRINKNLNGSLTRRLQERTGKIRLAPEVGPGPAYKHGSRQKRNRMKIDVKIMDARLRQSAGPIATPGSADSGPARACLDLPLTLAANWHRYPRASHPFPRSGYAGPDPSTPGLGHKHGTLGTWWG